MPVFASIHLGKTAGTSFANLLTRDVSRQMPVLIFYGEQHGLTGLWNNGIREPIKAEGSSSTRICRSLLQKVEAETCVMHGHFAASDYLEFLPAGSRFFTWLRHPLQRICSHYYYWKNHRLKPRQSPEAQPLFEDVVSGACSLVEFGRHPLIAEYYSHMLAPLGLDGLAVTAVVEHPRASLARLSTLLGVNLPSQMRVVNPTRAKPAASYELTADEQSQLVAANVRDMELYERALARLVGDSQQSST